MLLACCGTALVVVHALRPPNSLFGTLFLLSFAGVNAAWSEWQQPRTPALVRTLRLALGVGI
jgi:hypothetical protein